MIGMALDKDGCRAYRDCWRASGSARRNLNPWRPSCRKSSAFVEQLDEVNTDGVAPMTSVAAMTLPMREDVVTDGNRRDAVLV